MRSRNIRRNATIFSSDKYPRSRAQFSLDLFYFRVWDDFSSLSSSSSFLSIYLGFVKSPFLFLSAHSTGTPLYPFSFLRFYERNSIYSGCGTNKRTGILKLSELLVPASKKITALTSFFEIFFLTVVNETFDLHNLSVVHSVNCAWFLNLIH